METNYIELMNSSNPILRNRAAIILGKQGKSDDQTNKVLIRALLDPEWRVRGSAAKSLATLDPRNSTFFDHIKDLLIDEDESVRIESSSSIEYMIENGLVMADHQIDSISNFIKDNRYDVRVNVLRLLRRLRSQTSYSKYVIAAAVDDPIEEVRFWAIDAAASCNETTILMLPQLIGYLGNSSNEIRYAILSLIIGAKNHASHAVPAIRELLLTSDPHLRFYAAYALSIIDKELIDDSVVQVLNESLNSDNSDERRLAARTLENM